VAITFLAVMVILFSGTQSVESISESTEGNPTGDTVAMISLLEQRLERLEITLAGISKKISTAQTYPAGSETDMDVFAGRVERVENAMSTKFNIIADNIDKLDVQMADVVSRVRDLEKSRGGNSPARQVSQARPSSEKTNRKSAETATVSPVKTTYKSTTAQASDKKTALKKTTRKATKKAATPRVYHVVQKGDTFYSISKKYGITVAHLHKLNNFSKQPTIYPGDKLIVK
jgi:LysM repeat protein